MDTFLFQTVNICLYSQRKDVGSIAFIRLIIQKAAGISGTGLVSGFPFPLLLTFGKLYVIYNVGIYLLERSLDGKEQIIVSA